MPRKKKTAAPKTTADEPQGSADGEVVEMVAGRHGFGCADHEGDVRGGADFTTTPERATILESRNLAARKG